MPRGSPPRSCGIEAAPDGYTGFFGAVGTLATNVAAYRKLPYDPLRDFDPVTVTAITPMFIVVHPSFPAVTLAQPVTSAHAACPGCRTAVLRQDRRACPPVIA